MAIDGVKTSRQQRERRGRIAETVAVLMLRMKAYRILGRRQRLPAGEIDIVARRGDTIVFVEVKARKTRYLAAEAVSSGQRRRIVRAAAQYLAGRPDLAALTHRFDTVLVYRRALPQHIISAWSESGD